MSVFRLNVIRLTLSLFAHLLPPRHIFSPLPLSLYFHLDSPPTLLSSFPPSRLTLSFLPYNPPTLPPAATHSPSHLSLPSLPLSLASFSPFPPSLASFSPVLPSLSPLLHLSVSVMVISNGCLHCDRLANGDEGREEGRKGGKTRGRKGETDEGMRVNREGQRKG